ncbi:NYN domain-containing protein [Cupriavidus agavae]|uniref:NYN domain-containing protein n=2 Tax=Cupriavidus agavae TaxID=1001822 RepID=A0A4Q7R9S4_9BURK|nr:NYN domain-containing protein [Cupriavidus agavae]
MYVDGFNLYFGLRSKGWRKYYWLDLCALASLLMKPDQQLDGVHYFTSRLRVTATNAGTVQRQALYLEALGTRPNLHTHLGHYLEKKKRCHECGARWVEYEEKMTDVNIAVQMMLDAVHDRFDTAILVSGDSDLTTPLKSLRSQYPDKRLIIAFPPGRHSCELKSAAHGNFTIGESNLRKSQLPMSVTRADNFVLERPIRWR